MIESIETRLNFQAKVEGAQRVIELAMLHSQRPIVTSKFGPDSAVFLHLVTSVTPTIPVVWVDTGFNSKETLRFKDELTDQFQLNLRAYKAKSHPFVSPPSANTSDFDEFVQAVKIMPFRSALSDLTPGLWLSSLRRYQTKHRAAMSSFERISPSLLKVSPLIDWDSENIEHYRKSHQLSVGPVCIDPTKIYTNLECGMHTQNLSEVG